MDVHFTVLDVEASRTILPAPCDAQSASGAVVSTCDQLDGMVHLPAHVLLGVSLDGDGALREKRDVIGLEDSLLPVVVDDPSQGVGEGFELVEVDGA